MTGTAATVLWLLIFSGYHSYPVVSGIANEQECERIYSVLKAERWVTSGGISNDHKCVSYLAGAPR